MVKVIWKKITAKNKSSNFSTTVSNLWLSIARGPQKQGPCLITSSACFIHIFFNDYTGIPDPPENARNNRITSLPKHAVLCLHNVELSKTMKCTRSWQSIRSKWKCVLCCHTWNHSTSDTESSVMEKNQSWD